MCRLNLAAWALLAGGVCSSAVGARQLPPSDPCITITNIDLTVQVGDRVAVGGPGSVNFVPNEVFKVYVVPHCPWKEDDPLVDSAVATSLVCSNAEGTLLKSAVWKADRAGRFDIVVDYNDDGRFCSAFDAVTGLLVREK